MPDTERPLDLSALLALALVPDPAERLRRLATIGAATQDLLARVQRLKRAAVLELRRTEPLSWAEIGALFGVSAQAAEQLSRTPATPEGTDQP